MIGARLIRGPFDGAEFTITERLPDRITVEVECHDVDAEDPRFREAFFANLEGEPRLGQMILCRNATALRAQYVLEEDKDGAPFFGFAGWSIAGVSSGSHRKTPETDS